MIRLFATRQIAYRASTCVLLCFFCMSVANAQEVLGQEDIDSFDHVAEGPWSDLERTALVVPRVADASVTLDGAITTGEYGGFTAVDLVPVENAWILNFPPNRSWDGPEDSSAQFWLAHDDTYFYIAADVTDNVVSVNNASVDNWKDDSIEVFFDAFNNKYDVRSNDNSPYGGHDGISADGSQRAWDYDLEEPNGFANSQFATDVDWTNGPDGDVWAVGVETERGYAVEMRYHKRLFEDPDVGNKLEDDYVMGFNIAVDDEDGRGPDPFQHDLELAYYWSQRKRLIGWNEDEEFSFTEEEIEAGEHLDFYPLELTPEGRLTQGAMGEIIFSNELLIACNPDSRGDLDGNGTVEFADFLVLSTNFGTQVTGHEAGDIDCNGSVEFADFLVMSATFGTSVGGAQSVPEPAGWVSLASALSLFLSVRKRRFRLVIGGSRASCARRQTHP